MLLVLGSTAQVVDGFDTSTLPYISFRVANSNHKYRPYNDPTDFYDINPYDRTTIISPDHIQLQAQYLM